MPTIVFHGDHDPTVAASNGDAIVAQALAASSQASGLLKTRRVEPASAGVRGYTKTSYTTPQGRTLVEHWTVHGAVHAWSGGSADGSYTDAQGPDASAEMVRFFLSP